jgi:hypothetical protein
MPKRAHHEEHEDRVPDKLRCHLGRCSKQDQPLHPPGLTTGSSALSSDLFVSFVVKQSGVRTLLPAVVGQTTNEKTLPTPVCLAGTGRRNDKEPSFFMLLSILSRGNRDTVPRKSPFPQP